MTNRIILSVGALAAAASLASCGGAETGTGCRVQSVNWAAKYELVSGDPNSACGQLKGEYLGMQRYNENAPGTEKVAIRPFRLAALDAADTSANVPHALGNLPDNPTEGVCEATEVSTAVQAQGAAVHSYKFTNVKFLVTERAPGSQMGANLEYTVGGCTATYKVKAVWPASTCTDDSGCKLPKAPLNPDFDATCAPGIFNNASDITKAPVSACVPRNDFPSFQPGVEI